MCIFDLSLTTKQTKMNIEKLTAEYTQKYQSLDAEIEKLFTNRAIARKEMNEAWYMDLTIELKQKQVERQCYYQFTIDLQA